LIVGNRTRELECCNSIGYHDWSTIATYLETIRQWNCTARLSYYCKYGNSAHSSSSLFENLLQNYYCNYTAVVETCLTQVHATVSAVQQRSKNLSPEIALTSELAENTEVSLKLIEWKNLTSLLHPSLLTIDELNEPCIAIAQYGVDEIRNGGYYLHDFFLYKIFSKKSTDFCAFSVEALRFHNISFLSCLVR